MQRFGMGERILILPKFAALFPNKSGLVKGIRPDPLRPMFNEYIVDFPDGSTANLFEFQILEDYPNYQAVFAVLAFDSHQRAAATQVRGQFPDRNVILQTQTLDIDMRVHPGKTQTSIIGQVLERGTARFLKGVDVTLMKENVAISTTTTDNVGTFAFRLAASGVLNIEILDRGSLVRILGSFSI
ncbi:MAG TPA: hypothetical protein VE422_12090 [Terriglobia bacterium]|nr:hypothetical protein [Terriglobia bacterium]